MLFSSDDGTGHKVLVSMAPYAVQWDLWNKQAVCHIPLYLSILLMLSQPQTTSISNVIWRGKWMNNLKWKQIQEKNLKLPLPTKWICSCLTKYSLTFNQLLYTSLSIFYDIQILRLLLLLLTNRNSSGAINMFSLMKHT